MSAIAGNAVRRLAKNVLVPARHLRNTRRQIRV